MTLSKMRAALYARVSKSDQQTIPMQMEAMRDLYRARGWTIRWNKIMRVDRDSNSVYLELSTKTGNGYYSFQSRTENLRYSLFLVKFQ